MVSKRWTAVGLLAVCMLLTTWLLFTTMPDTLTHPSFPTTANNGEGNPYLALEDYDEHVGLPEAGSTSTGDATSMGGVIMGVMANNTARQILGSSTWTLLHVMASRYPLQPTKDEKEAITKFIYLLSRLYPCGDW